MGFLVGKTAIITGAGFSQLENGRPGSIGYGTAVAYAREGANLVITGRDVAKLERAREELEASYPVKVVPVRADISPRADNEAVVQNVVDRAVGEFGRIDVLVNVAQSSACGVALTEHTRDQFETALYSGLFATFYYMRACHPYLKEVKGTVINFGSGAALAGDFGQASYAAAKEGIRGLSRVAATEWAADGINVNVVCPLAWTSQLEQFQKAHPDAFAVNVQVPPAGRFGDAEADIGRICVALAGPDFKFMTGETIAVEGGLGLRP